MPKRTGRPWQRTKSRVIRRDDGICHLCGQPGATTADHLVPYSHGGTDELGNLAAAHVDCNRVRGNRPIDTARNDITRHASNSSWGW